MIDPAPSTDALPAGFMETLHSNPETKRQLLTFDQSLQDSRLIYDGKVVPVIPAPYIIHEKQSLLVHECVKELSRILERLAPRLLAQPRLRRYLHLTPVLESLMQINSHYSMNVPISRWDTFLHHRDLAVIEINADSPAGLAYTDVLDELFSAVHVVRETLARYHILNNSRMEAAWHVMIACYREFCKDLGIFREPKPSIAILNWRNVKVMPEYEIWRDFFISNGHESAIVDPRDLHVKGGTLFGSPINDPGRSIAIDLIYRRLVTYEITRELVQGDLAPFINACREGLACIVNPFKSNLITSKGVLALLSDASNASLFTRKEGKYIEKFVPWSRLLEKGETRYREREIELIPFLQAHPDRFVIKAARSRGGKEVILGNDPSVGREEWSQLIERHAREGGWIVQERVQIPELTLPVVRNRDITLETFKINLNPYVIGGKFCNAGCRASKSNIINVGVGGGQLPTFLVTRRVPESPE